MVLSSAFRRVLSFAALMVICLSPVLAQPEIAPTPIAPDAQGTVKGTIRLNTGQPCSTTSVLIRLAKWSTETTTDVNGAFQQTVPPGEGTVELGSIKQPITVRPGETSVVNIVLTPDHGVLLAVVNADGTPATGALRGAFRAPDGDNTSQGINLGGGKYWLPDVPANATALSVVAHTGGRYASGACRVQWTFTDAQALRNLEMRLLPYGLPRIKVVDEKGKPLADRKLKCTIAYSYPPYSLFWGEDTSVHNQLTNWHEETTDANGVLELGSFPPQRYTLTISDGNNAGKSENFAVTPDGKVSIDTYVLPSAQRRIVQTVFDTRGAPVPNAAVTATYCWGGKVVYKKAVTNAQGKVTWEDIPSARVIVYGPTIAAGVIPADAVEVTAPLPAPVPQEGKQLDLEFTMDVTLPAPADLKIYFRGPSFTSDPTVHFQGGRSIHSWRLRSTPGSPFTLIMLLESDPPKVAMLTGEYLPYLEGDDRRAVFQMPELAECGVLRGSFVLPDGRRVPGVSRLELLPLDPPDWLRVVQANPGLAALIRPAPVLQPDGSFTVSSIYPGSFRLLVDFLDAGAPDPNLTFALAPGKDETRVFQLPQPLAMAPGGTTVTYLPAGAPGRPRTLATHAFADTVPVFGPVELMLACWYRSAANTLMLRTRDTAWQSLKLRSVRFTPKNAPFTSGMEQFHVAPPLPGERELIFEPEHDYLLDMWPGQYLYTRDSDENAVYGAFEAPADRNAELAFRIGERWASTKETYALRVKLPALDLGEKGGAARVRFDVPSGEQTLSILGGGVLTLQAPRHAKTLSITCPGAGYLTDLPLPKFDPGETPAMTLPAFQPGVTLNGKVEAKVGTDLTKIILCLGGYPDAGFSAYEVTPAADGTFTMRNLAPGPAYLYLKNTYPRAGWVVNLPVKDDAPLTLRIDAPPVRIALPMGSGNPAALWWLPKDAPPRALPANGVTDEELPAELRGKGGQWLQTVNYDLAPGSGSLWALDATDGKSCYLPLTLTPGLNIVRPAGVVPPSLGILFPISEQAGLPGGVTLVGLGERAGITLTLPNFRWLPISALGILAGQIDAVPPGPYNVMVDTVRGPVKTMVIVGEGGGCARLGEGMGR